MTREGMVSVLAEIQYPFYTFTIGEKNGVWFLQAKYMDLDIDTATQQEQTTRKWQLSIHMTRSELVQTALKCVLTSAEHRVREHFKYRGERIYGPHMDCDELWKIARKTDVRAPMPEKP